MANKHKDQREDEAKQTALIYFYVCLTTLSGLAALGLVKGFMIALGISW